MPYRYQIRVHYPRKAHNLTLHTDDDWDSEFAPESCDDTNVATFVVKEHRPFFYFKPVLVDDFGAPRWAAGANLLAVHDEPSSLEIYPHFVPEGGGVISEAVHVTCSRTGDTHQYRVYTPPGYAENTLKRYPVLYMHDGKNLFFPHEAFGGEEWRVDETMDLLDAMNIVDKSIVVGVYPTDRMRQYVKPGYEDYGRFMVEQLQPRIDTMYRTLAGPENTALMGSSLGGVVSFYMAWNWPDVFGMSACLSSTFGWKDDLFHRVNTENKRKVRFYLDSGGPGDNYEVTRRMRDLLLKRGYGYGQDLLYFAFPADEHNERYWAARSHLPFQYFFGSVPNLG